MKTECAIYKELGYKIIILGEAHNYKRSNPMDLKY